MIFPADSAFGFMFFYQDRKKIFVTITLTYHIVLQDTFGIQEKFFPWWNLDSDMLNFLDSSSNMKYYGTVSSLVFGDDLLSDLFKMKTIV